MNYSEVPDTERDTICNELIGLLGNIQAFKGLENSTCNDSDNDNDNAVEDIDMNAEVGDIVEVVVNPDTPEEEIISGELLGVLEDEKLTGESTEDSTEQTVMVRTKNGRIRHAKISRNIKITNSRKQNKLSVKTSNKTIKKSTKNSDGLDAMRTGDTYAPPMKEGLVITKNRKTQNEEMTDADLTIFIRDAFQEGVQKALSETSNKRTQNDTKSVKGAVDDVFDDLFIKTKRIGNKKINNRQASIRRVQTHNENVTIPEDDGQLLLDAVKNLEEKVDIVIGNRRYIRTRNFKQITNADGDVEVIVDAGMVGIIPPDTAKITVSPLEASAMPSLDAEIASEASDPVVTNPIPGQDTVPGQDGWEPVNADDLEDFFDEAAAANARNVQNDACSAVTNNSEPDTTLETMLAVADTLCACSPRLSHYFPEVSEDGYEMVKEMI